MRGSVFKRCPCGVTGTPARGGKPAKPACRKPHGTWTWRADAEPGAATRRQPSQGGYATREAAQEGLNDHLAAVQGGTYSDDKNQTVEQWLTTWLERVKKRRGPKTYEGRRSHVLTVLIPHLGTIRLRDLRYHHIDTMIAEAATPAPAPAPRIAYESTRCTGTRNDGQPCTRWANHGYDRCARHTREAMPAPAARKNSGRVVEQRSGRTLASYRETLRVALNAAKREGLISVNPAEGTIDSMPSQVREATDIWEPEEVARFLTAVTLDRMAAAYEVAAFAGLRRGELLGLRWEDIDFDGPNPGITIRQSVAAVSGEHACSVCGKSHRGRYIKPPKNPNSSRWVPLVPETIHALRLHRQQQDVERERFGITYVDHQLVFPMEHGQPFLPGAVTQAFKARAAELGLPEIRLHDMRHGAGSLLLAGGQTVATVALILGHSPEVMQKVYAHVLRGPASAGMKAAVALVRPPADPT